MTLWPHFLGPSRMCTPRCARGSASRGSICMRTELCWLDDVEVRPVEERPLDDAALEVGPVDAVVVEVVVDADRPVERRQFDGRHAPQVGVQLVDLVAVVVGNQEEIVSTKTRCRFDREKTATTTECSVVSETSL